MNIETKFDACAAGTQGLTHDGIELIAQGLGALDPLARTCDTIGTILADLVKVGDRATVERARKLSARLAEIEPSITMIGQVKAGKTSLVNAMVGMPDLLPSDVNPWTSVVTSLHLDPSMHTAQNSARFEFFDRMDWDRLVIGGGRIGELAQRAGTTSELEQVTKQVAELQEKSRKRLGNKFELLLGQEHDYGYFDRDLIERYICLGDDFENDIETSKDRGRFADITKAAHIYMHNPATPTKLCIRDTPGVNDTFLVREQVTMKAIRGSQVCVVVLAAHQALSSVDLALVRMISNLQSRDVIIFVNRIDELADPASQVPEIRNSIVATLQAHKGPEDAEIIFGSAQWANHLLNDSLMGLGPDSAEALLAYTQYEFENLPKGLNERQIVWHLSGLAALHRAVADRVQEGAGHVAVSAVGRSARNLLNGIKLTNVNAETQGEDAPRLQVDADLAAEEFAKIEAESLQALEEGLQQLHGDFVERIERVHESYLDRATAALIHHLDTSPEGTAWHYDPTGLRMLLRSSYRTFAKRSKDLIKDVFSAAVEENADFFERTFSMPAESFDVEAPDALAAPEPVVLGKTIALDLESNWWASWWQKQTGAKSQTQKFSELISAETQPMLQALREDYAEHIRSDAQALLNEFLAEQQQMLEALTRPADIPAEGAQTSIRQSKLLARLKVVDRSLERLDDILAEAAE